ncbi:unnamed protein product, partial [Arabidopsis halleri]
KVSIVQHTRTQRPSLPTAQHSSIRPSFQLPISSMVASCEPCGGFVLSDCTVAPRLWCDSSSNIGPQQLVTSSTIQWW